MRCSHPPKELEPLGHVAFPLGPHLLDGAEHGGDPRASDDDDRALQKVGSENALERERSCAVVVLPGYNENGYRNCHKHHEAGNRPKPWPPCYSRYWRLLRVLRHLCLHSAIVADIPATKGSGSLPLDI
jgi:hypothetical protein